MPLFLAAGGGLSAVAVRLLAARDVGLGLVHARPGPPGARRLGSGVALAARLHRGRLVSWTIGFAVFGALTGSLAATAGNLLTDNARIEQLMQRIGGAGRPADELLAVLAALAGLLAAVYAVAAALQVRSEETSGRAELGLSTALSRVRLLAAHLLFSAVGAATLLVVAGLAAGLVYGAQTGDLGAGLRTGVSALAVQIPAVLVIAGLTAALIGWLPRQAAGAWLLLGLFAVLGQLGRSWAYRGRCWTFPRSPTSRRYRPGRLRYCPPWGCSWSPRSPLPSASPVFSGGTLAELRLGGPPVSRRPGQGCSR